MVDFRSIEQDIAGKVHDVLEAAAGKETDIASSVAAALDGAGLGELAPVVAAVIPALIAFGEKHIKAAPAAAPAAATTAAPAAEAPAPAAAPAAPATQ